MALHRQLCSRSPLLNLNTQAALDINTNTGRDTPAQYSQESGYLRLRHPSSPPAHDTYTAPLCWGGGVTLSMCQLASSVKYFNKESYVTVKRVSAWRHKYAARPRYGGYIAGLQRTFILHPPEKLINRIQPTVTNMESINSGLGRGYLDFCLQINKVSNRRVCSARRPSPALEATQDPASEQRKIEIV